MPNPFHLLAHRIGTNASRVTTWRESGRLMVGIQCKTCGKVQGAHEMPRFPELKAALALQRGEA